MSNYFLKLIDLSEKGICEISGLLTEVFGKRAGLTPKFINWQYNHNPVGPAVGFNAWMGDELVAHYVNLPLIADLEGKRTKGLHTTNAATLAKHRGKSLYTQLADKTHKHGFELGYEFLIGAGGNRSASVLIKLGAKLIRPLDVKIGIGFPNMEFGADYDYSRYWDKSLLKWRLSNPKVKYEIQRVKDHFFVIGPTGRYGIKIILGCLPMTLLPDSISLTSHQGINPLLIWLGLDKDLLWKGKMFINFPDKLKPSPLKLTFRDLTGKNRYPEPGYFKFMGLDWDVF